MALWKSPMKSSLRTQLFLEFPKHVKVLCFKLLHYTLCFSSWNRMINRYFMTEVSQFLLEPFLNIAFRFIKIIGLRCAVKIIFCLGFPFAKPFLQFLWKKTQIFAFVALHFCAKKIALCAIICKLDFAQNCAIPLLCYSVLRNFAIQILDKRLKGVNFLN